MTEVEKLKREVKKLKNQIAEMHKQNIYSHLEPGQVWTCACDSDGDSVINAIIDIDEEDVIILQMCRDSSGSEEAEVIIREVMEFGSYLKSEDFIRGQDLAFVTKWKDPRRIIDDYCQSEIKRHQKIKRMFKNKESK